MSYPNNDVLNFPDGVYELELSSERLNAIADEQFVDWDAFEDDVLIGEVLFGSSIPIGFKKGRYRVTRPQHVSQSRVFVDDCSVVKVA